MLKIIFKLIAIFRNIYALILLAFIIWMIFFDAHSFFFHQELNEDIEDLKNQKKHYKTQIKNDSIQIKILNDDEGIERIAREKYFMKKSNEDIFIIEYEDSLLATKQIL